MIKRRVSNKEPEPKQEVKKEVKKVEKKKTEKKKDAVIPPVIPPPPPIIPPVEIPQVKSEHDGVGIIGNNNDIAIFKGLCKMKNKKVGSELMLLIKEWNLKNKL